MKTLNEPASSNIIKDKTFFNTSLKTRCQSNNDHASESNFNTIRNIRTGLITITVDKFRN